MNRLLVSKIKRAALARAEALLGRLRPLDPVLDAMAARPYELKIDLTNACNANCIFCPYQFQTRKPRIMAESVFRRAVEQYAAMGGGSVGLTPIVGEVLIDPDFVPRVRFLRSFPQIDRISLTTNAILIDKHGPDEILRSGLTSIIISTAGFDRSMYERVYRTPFYDRMYRNVLALLACNAKLPDPLPITLALRPDVPLSDVMRHPDFQALLKFDPPLDFAWSYASAGGRIRPEALPPAMRLREVSARDKTEPCLNLFGGPTLLSDGTLLACGCSAAMDSDRDLSIGNMQTDDLQGCCQSDKMHALRASFRTSRLNPTCAACDSYRNLDLYRTREGRCRAEVNRLRLNGVMARRESARPFFGGA